MSSSESFESFEVFRDMPGDIPIHIDYAVLPDCSDDGEFHGGLCANFFLYSHFKLYRLIMFVADECEVLKLQLLKGFRCNFQTLEWFRGALELLLQSVDMVDVDVGIDNYVAEKAGLKTGLLRKDPCKQ